MCVGQQRLESHDTQSHAFSCLAFSCFGLLSRCVQSYGTRPVSAGKALLGAQSQCQAVLPLRAGAAQLVSKQGLKDVGAIASKQAGELYGLEILDEGIQDMKDNVTRFIVLSRCCTGRVLLDVSSLPCTNTHPT
jgi:Prephenate dehydratase